MKNEQIFEIEKFINTYFDNLDGWANYIESSATAFKPGQRPPHALNFKNVDFDMVHKANSNTVVWDQNVKSSSALTRFLIALKVTMLKDIEHQINQKND